MADRLGRGQPSPRPRRSAGTCITGVLLPCLMPPSAPDVPHMSSEEFRRLGHDMVDFLADYHARIESLPVQSRVAPGDLLLQLPPHAPERGEPWAGILADIDRLI